MGLLEFHITLIPLGKVFSLQVWVNSKGTSLSESKHWIQICKTLLKNDLVSQPAHKEGSVNTFYYSALQFERLFTFYKKIVSNKFHLDSVDIQVEKKLHLIYWNTHTHTHIYIYIYTNNKKKKQCEKQTLSIKLECSDTCKQNNIKTKETIIYILTDTTKNFMW